MQTGTIYIVATPIGNMEDITYRAIRILREVDYIAAEDTRNTIKLLNHFDIKTKLISYHKHNEQKKHSELLTDLEQGKNIALVSDAGTPLISDPGSLLVNEASKRGYGVVPIPGACAAITALCACGIYDEGFTFFGFIPQKSKDKQDILEKINQNQITSILYESPHRLLKTLISLKEVLDPNREIVVAREMTKIYEEFIRGTATSVLSHFENKTVKGEIVIIVSGTVENNSEVNEDEIIALLNEYIQNGYTKKDAVIKTASTLSLPKNTVYKFSLEL